MRIISWNVNGIRAAHKKGFLEWLDKESPDVMCVQETKASEDQLPAALREIPGYDSYFVSAEKKGYSGEARQRARAACEYCGLPEEASAVPIKSTM